MRILLPGLMGAGQITLDVKPKSVSAHVAGKYRLDSLPLPYEVDAERFRATFNIDKQALQLTLTVVPPPSTSTRHPAQAESPSAAQPERPAAELLAARPGGSRNGSEVGTVATKQDAAATSVAPRAAEAAATACGHGRAEAEAHSQQAASQMGAAVKGSAGASRAGDSDTDSCCDAAHTPAPAKASQCASSADGQGRQLPHEAPAEALSADSDSTTLGGLDAGPPAQHADDSDGLTENERHWRQLHPLTGLQAQTAAVSAQLDSSVNTDAALMQRAAAGLSMQRASTCFALLSYLQTSSCSWQGQTRNSGCGMQEHCSFLQQPVRALCQDIATKTAQTSLGTTEMGAGILRRYLPDRLMSPVSSLDCNQPSWQKSLTKP